MNTAWIVLGLVFILVVIDWMIGRSIIKRCEAEMVRALKYAEKLKEETMAEVDEKVKINERQDEKLVTEWQVYIYNVATEMVKIHQDIMHAPITEQKPAEVKLTLDFKGIKK